MIIIYSAKNSIVSINFIASIHLISHKYKWQTKKIFSVEESIPKKINFIAWPIQIGKKNTSTDTVIDHEMLNQC